jgi:hypothetical protein
MSIPASLAILIGKWSGVNRLWLSPNDPAQTSHAAAEIYRVAQEQFLAIAYTWAENGPQDGLILLGWQPSSGALQASWVDSFHNGDRMMPCLGQVTDDGRIAVQGAYSAPPGPDWGWQIAIEPEGPDALRVVMDNITPDGEHFLAVEIALARR